MADQRIFNNKRKSNPRNGRRIPKSRPKIYGAPKMNGKSLPTMQQRLNKISDAIHRRTGIKTTATYQNLSMGPLVQLATHLGSVAVPWVSKQVYKYAVNKIADYISEHEKKKEPANVIRNAIVGLVKQHVGNLPKPEEFEGVNADQLAKTIDFKELKRKAKHWRGNTNPYEKGNPLKISNVNDDFKIQKSPNHLFGQGYAGMIGYSVLENNRYVQSVSTNGTNGYNAKGAAKSKGGINVRIDAKETAKLDLGAIDPAENDIINIRITVDNQMLSYIACTYANYFNTVINDTFAATHWGYIVAGYMDDLQRAIAGQPSFLTEAPRSYWLIRNSLVPRQYGAYRYIVTTITDSLRNPADCGFYLGNITANASVTGNTALPATTVVTSANITFSDEYSYTDIRIVHEALKGKIRMVPNHGQYACPYVRIDDVGSVPTSTTITASHPGVFQDGTATTLRMAPRTPITFPHPAGPMDATMASLCLGSVNAASYNVYPVDGVQATTLRSHGSPGQVLGHMIYCDVNDFPMHAYTYDIIYSSFSGDMIVEGYLQLVNEIFKEKLATNTAAYVQEHAAACYAAIFSWFARWAWATPTYSAVGTTGNWENSYFANTFTIPNESMMDQVFPAFLLETLYRISPVVTRTRNYGNAPTKAIYYPVLRLLSTKAPGDFLAASYTNFTADPGAINYYSNWTGQFGYWTIDVNSTILVDLINLNNYTPVVEMPRVSSRHLQTTAFDVDDGDGVYRCDAIVPREDSVFRSDGTIRAILEVATDRRNTVRSMWNIPYIDRRPEKYTAETLYTTEYLFGPWIMDSTKPLNADIALRLEEYARTQGRTSKKQTFETKNGNKIVKTVRVYPRVNLDVLRAKVTRKLDKMATIKALGQKERVKEPKQKRNKSDDDDEKLINKYADPIDVPVREQVEISDIGEVLLEGEFVVVGGKRYDLAPIVKNIGK